MNYKITKNEKSELINRYLSGESVAAIIDENNLPRSTFYLWLKKSDQIENFSILFAKFFCISSIINCTGNSSVTL